MVWQGEVCACAFVIAFASGCAPGGSDGGEVEPRCSDVAAQPFAALTDHVWLRETSVCGQVVVERSMPGGWDLVHDDARTVEPLGDIADPVFAPTGHLLAYIGDGSLVLRDLERETTTIVGPRPQSFGFVGSADASRGAWLYTCDAGRILRHDSAESTTELALGIDCHHIAVGGPTLVAFDADRMVAIDVDDAGVQPTDHVRGDGFEHVVVVSDDGALAIHEVLETIDCDDECDHSYSETVEASAIDLRTGAVVSHLEGYAVSLDLVGTTGHLARGFDRTNSFLLDDGVRMDIGENEGWQISGDATAAFIRRDGTPDRIERLDVASGSMAIIAQFADISAIHPSDDGITVAFEHRECAELEQDGSCARKTATLRVWHGETGVGEPLVQGWQLDVAALLPDGRVLVTGELPIDGERVPASAWIDADGTMLESWRWPQDSLSPGATAIGAVASGFVFATGPWDALELQVAEPDGTTRTLGLVGEVSDAVIIPERDALVAKLGTTLWAGALPRP